MVEKELTENVCLKLTDVWKRNLDDIDRKTKDI